MKDYAGAWAAERARCHRFVYDDEDGRPQTCPQPVTRLSQFLLNFGGGPGHNLTCDQ